MKSSGRIIVGFALASLAFAAPVSAQDSGSMQVSNTTVTVGGGTAILTLPDVKFTKSYDFATGITQSDIAREIGVHRSVINRELRGRADITLGRVAELAYAMGRVATIELPEPEITYGANISVSAATSPTVSVITDTTNYQKELSPTNLSVDSGVA